MDQMKPYKLGLNGQKIPFLYYKPATVPEDNVWVVEKILKHRVINGRMSWLVQWKGYSKPTWESAENFVEYTRMTGRSIT